MGDAAKDRPSEVRETRTDRPPALVPEPRVYATARPMAVTELVFHLAGMGITGAIAIIALGRHEMTAFWWVLAVFAAIAGVPVTQVVAAISGRGNSIAGAARTIPLALAAAVALSALHVL